jgi:hypothetical protein
MNESSMSLSGASARSAPRMRWFDRRGWCFGSSEFNVAALGIHLFVGLFPLAAYVFGGFAAPTWPRDFPLLTALWAGFVALGYPLFAMLESRSFQAWARGLEPAQRAAEQAEYAGRAALAKNYWFGVLAAYLVVAMMGFVVRG